ncbi:hypothetical protein BUALT_Bualt01G0129400 [Buddleja alternifolia]|uniref:CASP-like protein n=1 Tax=Buddleja alternifolia TaxID=168488 RepID=A0AAV6YH55_9LAMI|nr:hypothetical protein BUALT_Bualt01G0129400 [Buddleja alternifolia]
MAPPPSNAAVSPFVSLIFLIIYSEVRVRFKDFKAFRYQCATTVIGLAYTVLQTAFTIFLVTTGNRLGGEGIVYIDFYGDKLVSYLLATGAAASFGMTQDLDSILDAIGLGISHFINTTNAAASLCLIGCVFTAVSSIFSSFALPKRASV